MIENYEIIKANVLTLTEFQDSTKVDLQIRAAIDECLAYCYRQDVPPEMELPLSNVIADILTVGTDGTVTNYREGDMSVTIAQGGAAKYNGKLEGFKLIRGAF